MKKSILWLSGLGIGAGVLYALSSRRASSVNGNGKSNHLIDESTGNANSQDKAASHQDKKSSMTSLGGDDSLASDNEQVHPIDDQGTDQTEASQLLRHIRDAAFDSSNENLALALGRPAEEIDEEITGARLIDGDELMKARNLAILRGVEIG
jgi:hypothetical protein